ncbi:MAG: hypothetical protein K6F59_03955, partial [Gammaproteobacteria bacterium]|nr:hypothetical protein [Gammaproteobacteria bacterium]
IVFMGLFLFGCEKKTKSISTTKSNNTSSSEVTKGSVSKTTNPYVTEKPTTTTTTASKTTLPLDLEGETFTIDCTALSGGTYTSNWVNGTYVKKSPTDSLGYSIGGYRVGNTYSNIVPDVSIYKGTAYEGREGAVYNVTPFNTIKALKVTYETERSNASDPRTPNVTFGTDKRCKDYKHVLSSSESFTEVTINVNGLDFNFFSFNSGDYYTTLKTIEVVYESTQSVSSSRVAESGKNKVRLNPITYAGTKVPGETKVTVPTKVEYDSTTNTYKAVSEKEFTYYTYTYISNHPDEVDNAAIIDPIEVCMYFTIFGTWPANYAEKNGSNNVNTIRSVFGSKTRQVSIYNRTDGYATSVPWVGTGKYYELDINFDGTYSTGSRGSGRVVAWKDGFTATGYDNSPVCLYTDDHYNTWLEYYNNGTWSNRYDAEGNITGVSFSAATTVTLTGFDPKIVEGDPSHAEGGGQGGGDIPNIEVNDEDYYANFAPATLINDQTAKWQQVTNISGIVEGNKYYFVCGTGTNSANYDRNIHWKANNGVLEYVGDEDWKDYYALNNPFYFEKTEGGYYLYKYDYNGNKVYYRFYDAKKDIEPGQGLWQIKFSGGNFYLYVVKDGNTYALQRNNDVWRTYTSGTQQAIQLFRFCDIEGATPPEGGGGQGQGEDLTEYNSNFEKITSLDDINDDDEYIFVSNKYLKCVIDYNPNSKYKLDNDGNLLVSKDAEYLAFHIKKHKDAWNEEYYEVYVMSEGTKYYLTYLESSTYCYMNLSTTATYIDLFYGSNIFICPAYMNDNGVCESYLKNGDWACLMYNEETDFFVFDNITSENINNLVSIYKVLDDNTQQGEEEFNTDYEEI